MKKLLNLFLVFGMTFGLSLWPASAEEKEKEELKFQGKAVSGTETIKAAQRSSKFFEYRDVPKGFVFNWLDLNIEKGDRYFYFSAKGLRQDDARYQVSLGDYGKFNLDYTWDKIPHRFSYFGKTLYSEARPGVYTLADSIQIAAQNLVGDGAYNGTYNMRLARSLVSDYLSGVHDVDLGLQRNKGTLNFTYNPLVPLSFTIKASMETREGTRPFSASLGFSHVVEVPEPIDYKTTDIKTSVEYSRKWGTIQAGYYASLFENNVQTLTWDNPYRITDQTYEGVSPLTSAYSPGNGTSKGQMALWPSNTAHRFYLNTSFKILKSTRFSSSFSYGTFSQDEKILPVTVNTAIPAAYPEAANALYPPRATAEAKAYITSLDLTLSSKIFRYIYLVAGYRYYNFDNKTEELDMSAGYSRFDQVWEKVPVAVEPYHFVRSRLFGDLSFNFLKNTSFKLGYSFSSIERKLGHEDEGKSEEGMIKASLDSNPFDWMYVRVSYLSAKREWSEEGKKNIYSPVFNFKRYFEANRDRHGINFLVGFSPLQNLDIQASYMSGKDKYTKSDYGLKKDDFVMYSFDLSYSLSQGAVLYGFYSNEVYKGDQASRQSGATISTSTLNDWTAALKDKIDTFGAGINYDLIKDKVKADLSYTYSRAKGTSALDSPPGGTPDLALNFTKPLDTTTLKSLRTEVLWKLWQNLSIAFGYWYEEYKLDDIVRNDMRVDTLATGYGIYLGALEPSYKYHVGFLKFIWTW